MTYLNQKYFPQVQNQVLVHPDGSKTFDQTNHPLILLYGENAMEEAVGHISEIDKQSNIDLMNKTLMSTGISFSTILAEKVLNNEEQFPPRNLKDHLTRSFGEASMFHHQCEGGAFYGK